MLATVTVLSADGSGMASNANQRGQTSGPESGPQKTENQAQRLAANLRHCRSGGCALAGELIVIGFIQQLANILHALSLLQEAAERVVAQLPGDIFERPQVIARAIRRRHQQEEQMHLVAVQAVEVNAVVALVRQSMQSAYTLRVPLKVDVEVGPNWRDLAAV